MKKLLYLLFLAFANIAFAQNPCTSIQDYTIVVLGSSTAAGAGASQSDSAWVNRYRKAIQQINPNNQVINLGVGGFTSYRIMPDNHQPNPGRPLPNTAKNITKALTYNPDAIIINLPSNDIASGFPITEQIFNFDSIVALANNFGVPVWVCTTQPKNMSLSNMQLQVNMRDSIYAHFSPNVLDFWTTLASANNSLSTTYDSGDGTHLNDAGHGLLANRTLQKDILSALYILPNQLDYAIIKIIEHSPFCGDSLAHFEVVLANIGNTTVNNYNLDFELEHLPSNIISSQNISNFTNLNTCESDTFNFYAHTIIEGDYSAKAIVNSNSDFDILNNEKTILIHSVGQPTATLIGDTSCAENAVILEALHASIDTAFWYDSPMSNNPIGFGTTFLTPNLTATTDFYVQIVRGDLFYKNNLTTTLNSSINWNGTMFDITPLTDLTIDSFGVKINNLGQQNVDIYYKNGTHIGSENNAAVWTFLGTTTVNVTDISELTTVPSANLSFTANTTYGIYIQLSNANARLSYQTLSNPITRSNSELSITTGSGISHNFSGSFYPRDWNGTIYYHHGFRPLGDCSTDLLPIMATVSTPFLDIGSDTIIDIYSTLNLSVSGFDSYLWSDGSTLPQTTLLAQNLGVGIHFITLEALDSLGCLMRDTLILGIADLVQTNTIIDNELITIYPNPFTDYFIVKNSKSIDNIQLLDVNGKLLKLKSSHKISETEVKIIPEYHLPKGIYYVKVGRRQIVILKL
ncbi:MAG: lysophospholipase L1-like esterase [Saprospiraceae bacterium]|jgi:lysophospholipase L1-like esterase